MKFKPYKMNPMNEALIGQRMLPKEPVEDVVAAVPIAYADAVNQHMETEKKLENDFKEKTKEVDDFLKVNHNKEQKLKSTPELKKMKLAEAVDFGDPMEFGRGPCVPIVYDMTSDITQLVKMLGEGDDYRDYGITTLKRLVPKLMDNKQSVENFNAYWAERYPAAIDYIDKQLELIPADVLNTILQSKTESIESDDLEELFDANISLDASGSSVGFLGGSGGTVKNEVLDLNVGLDASKSSVGFLNGTAGNVSNESVDDDNIDDIKEFLDFEIPVTASVQANGNTVPFLNGTSKTGNTDPDFFQLDDDTLNESPVAVAEPETKKRVRSPNEEKDPWDYSSEDVWYAVYDELSASVDNEGKGQQVDKQIKAKRGERYEHVYPHGEKDIIVYAKSPEEFEFAKKVADHYGVTCEEPKRDENKNSNGFYKYSMVINMPDLF